MAFYDVTKLTSGLPISEGSVLEVKRTSFAEQNIQERHHLQAALRDHIDLIAEGLLVEEFGDFEGANRRIPKESRTRGFFRGDR